MEDAPEDDVPAWLHELTYVVVRRRGQLRAVWRVNRITGWVAKNASGWFEAGFLPYQVFVEGLDHEEQIVSHAEAMEALKELGASEYR